jgi:hypothetical protein
VRRSRPKPKSKSKRKPRPARDSVAQLHQGISRQLPRVGLPLVAAKRSARWSPRMLVIAIILFTLDSGQTVAERFAAAYDGLSEIFKSRRRPGTDPQGFVRALCRRSAALLELVCRRLRRRVRLSAGREHWRTGRWLAFGVDGSRFNCPRSRANDERLGCAGKDKTGPQMLVTTVFHVGTGLVWDFRRGDGKSSERSHLLQMLDTLPKETMLLADAGFTGYEFLTAIAVTGRHFLVRVGASVTLLRKLGWCCELHDGIVHLWPDAIQRKQKQPPLTLRLITVTDERNRRMHLLSNVLDRAELSDAEAIELYGKRWVVEVIYRSLKQTLNRRKLVCKTPEHAAAELDWAVVSVWALALMTAEEVSAAGKSPARLSIAKALAPVRRAIRSATPRYTRRLSLALALSKAVQDDYQRTSSKAARVPVNKKRDKPPGDPKARLATRQEKALAKAFRERISLN